MDISPGTGQGQAMDTASPHRPGEIAPPVPRRWWSGPLDVERLAWESVQDAVRAVRALAEVRGCACEPGTSPELIAASFDALGHLRVDGRAPEAWAPLSGFFPTADGWVRLHANYPHHRDALVTALGVTGRAAPDRPAMDRAAVDRAAPDRPAADVDAARLRSALLERTALEVEEAVTQGGGIAVAVRTAHQWAAHPQARATAADPWVSVQADGGRPRPGRVASRAECTPLLAGVRVLDLTRVIAGPSCTQLLACLGADVLRVDPPHRPELADQHLSTGMGKRSAVADLGAVREELEELLAGADVVLLGYRPGSLDRFGLSPEALRARHPRLVVCSLSAWGAHGPWGGRPGFDSIVQAASGIAVACADPETADGRPGALPVQALDHATGYRMAAAVVELLATGRSGTVTASLLGAARTLLDLPAPPGGSPEVPPRRETAVPLVETAWARGRLTAAPPPLTLGGRTLERPVGGYGAADLRW